MLELDGYTHVARLASTTKSEVYAAVRQVDGTRVVLKRYFEKAAPSTRPRVQVEHELLQRIQAPGIVRSLAVELSAVGPILVLERTPGIALSQFVEQRGPFDSKEFLDVALQITQALCAVHETRILHRDIKPSNLLIVPETSAVCLIDFGLAAPYGASQSGTYGTVVTGLEGSLQYMAPEQTGRMDRGVDFRSDLYSLGATFYHLLTAQPPFTSDDPLALIHAHMARRPPPPREVRPQVPKVLSDLIDKLLQKEPEQRYQTAAGLKADLVRCREQLERTGEIGDLVLETSEAPERPLFARRLYGRDAEIRILQESYAECARTGAQLLVLEGSPGVGKSALVAAVRERAAATNGYVAQGKFDLYDRERPFQGFVAAFESLIAQWLTESPERLTRHEQELKKELGALEAVMIDLVSDLAFILHDFAPVPALGPSETQARLSLAVQRFARACAKRDQPLVLVLDDLQWADAGSRMLLEALLTEAKCEALLVLGTCRDNDAGAGDLDSSLTRLIAQGVIVKRVRLAPLAVADTTALLATALLRSPQDTHWLAECAARKTGNVPLLVEHFVDLLWEQGLLRYEHSQGWVWDKTAIESAEIPDSAVGLMTAKIQHLDPRLQALLGLASCTGDVFDLESLVQLSKQDRSELETVLQQLSDTGLIGPCREGFRFAHDRVREAAQASLADADRAHLHAEMGLLLLERTAAAERAEQAPRIADHLNRGRDWLKESERIPALELNLLAYRRSLSSGAKETATHYASQARSWFHESDWESRPELAFWMFLAVAESSVETGALDTARETVAVLEKRPLERMQAARVAMLKIAIHARTELTQETGYLTLALARRFGIRWPRRPSRLRTLLTILHTDWLLRDLGEKCFRRAPPENREWMAGLLVLSAGAVALTGGTIRLVLLLAALSIRLSRKHGYVNAPAFSLIAYAGNRLGVLQRTHGAQRYLKAAVEWDARVNDPPNSCRFQILSLMYLHSWFRPRRSLVEPLRAQCERAREFGDQGYWSMGMHVRASYAALSGLPPSQVHDFYNQYRQFFRGSGRVGAVDLADRPYVTLARESVSAAELDQDLVQAEDVIASDRGWGPYFAIHWLVALCLLDRFEHAHAIAERVRPMVFDSSAMMSHVVDYTFYRGLAAAVVAGNKSRGRWKLQRILSSSLHRIRRDALDSPDFVHMKDFLAAEQARLQGNGQRAQALYEQAAQRAMRQGYLQHGGLAHERRASLLRLQRREQAAQLAHARALECYRQWGSPAVVARLSSADPGDAQEPWRPDAVSARERSS